VYIESIWDLIVLDIVMMKVLLPVKKGSIRFHFEIGMVRFRVLDWNFSG